MEGEGKGFFKKGPLVILAAGGTGGVLAYGLYKFVSNPRPGVSSTRAMRGRVALQFSAVAAMLGYAAYSHFFTQPTVPAPLYDPMAKEQS